MKLPFANGRLLSTLISLTYDRKSIISYRAIEAFGIVSKEIAKDKTRTREERCRTPALDDTGRIRRNRLEFS